MHEKAAPAKQGSIIDTPGKLKEGKMPNGHPAAAAADGSTAKSVPFRQCKSFNLKEGMLPHKPPSSHEISKIAKSNGASISKPDVPAISSGDAGGKTSKLNGACKSSAKPKQKDTGKLEPKAEALPMSRSERVKSPSNTSISKSPSSKVLNVEGAIMGASKVKKTKEAKVQNLSFSLNADPQKKLPPIKTAHAGGGGGKSVSAKNTANLCTECKAELEGAVCFIGNDGRVSACTSRRLCKNLKCANNNPEYVASLAAAIAAPKKYLVSRRHSLNLPRSSTKGTSDKVHAQSSNPNGIPLHGSDVDAANHNDRAHECSEQFDMQGELEDDVGSLEEIGEVVDIDGIASASPHYGRVNRLQRMRRRSFSVIETQGLEVVTLKKQMMQERKQAEEWMLDYAIEEALHKLAPSKDSKVKALVEAFESITLSHKDVDQAVAQDRSEGPKTPSKIPL